MQGLLRYLNRRRLGQSVVYLEYPYDFESRWGDAGNPHLRSIIESSDGTFRAALERMSSFLPLVKQMRFDWTNHQLPALDALSIMWAAQDAKRLFVEIGSGYSTMCAREALSASGSTASLVSIDPHPRAEVDQLCDEVIRQPVEMVDIGLFDRLDEGDVLFFDGSHRSFVNSDVTTVFMDVIPRLKPGVLVGVHDIFLPFDYPAKWKERAYNEQYLLAAFLLANPGYFSLQLCNNWIARQGMHVAPLADIWATLGPEVRDRHGSAFWVRKN